MLTIGKTIITRTVVASDENYYGRHAFTGQFEVLQ